MTDTLLTVTRLVEAVIGDQPLVQITADTSFGNDLELESIELVALAEKLQAEYADRVDFVSWLSSKELDELTHLKVGELVEYIDQCLSSTPTA